uniref:Uncharacterized protein n=1 Tax=Lotus japonicus TaxID=34305 RepID=I3SKK7_LOTJA|nr:unknown [Lotus japonicus]
MVLPSLVLLSFPSFQQLFQKVFEEPSQHLYSRCNRCRSRLIKILPRVLHIIFIHIFIIPFTYRLIFFNIKRSKLLFLPIIHFVAVRG